jgi:hypothetical protein
VVIVIAELSQVISYSYAIWTNTIVSATTPANSSTAYH